LFIAVLSCSEISEIEATKDGVEREIKTASKELLNDTVILDMKYIGIMCPCAQWATEENFIKFNEQIENNDFVKDSILYDIKPAHDSLPSPSGLDYKYRFYGRFYKEIQWINWEDGSEPAITLQYYKFEVLNDSLEISSTESSPH
jgi:hypothetical protein